MDKRKETITKTLRQWNIKMNNVEVRERNGAQSETFPLKSSLMPFFQSSRHFLNLRKKTLPDA